jgi:hypothetical protein
MTLATADAIYRESIGKGRDFLQRAFSNALALDHVDVQALEITEAMSLRMKAVYLAQQDVKSFLAKRVAQAASDVFVETLVFFLKVWAERVAPNISVQSEATIPLRSGTQRPDISVWQGNELKAVIECKTQLGRQRTKWRSQFEDREALIQQTYPDAGVYLVVLTARKWGGFGTDLRVGKQFFTILKCLPSRFATAGGWKADIENPIEPLFEALFL